MHLSRGHAQQVLQRLSPETVQPGEAIRLEIKLANRSSERIHHVVRPGDGSDVGWREPHVFYSAWIDRGNNQWEKLPAARYARSKEFNSRWQNDVADLPPGKGIVLKEWLAPPQAMIEVQQPGHVRLQVHYAYRGGIVGRPDAVGHNFDKGKLLGVPAFEIVSKPVELQVVRPLDVVLKVKAPLRAKKKTRLSEILDVRLVNRSAKPVAVKAPTLSGDARLSLEVQGGTMAPPALSVQDQPYGKTATLSPGEEAAILGDAAMANGIDGTWEVAQPGRVKVRAVYQTSTWNPGAVIKSDWVELKIVE